MAALVQFLILAIEKWPILEQIFMKVFQAYMIKKHKIDMVAFVEAEVKARSTGDVRDLQDKIGRKLK